MLLLVIALILVHALATAEDAMGDNLRTVFLPWQESWSAAVFACNIGIFALYLAVLVGPTYYLRRRIGTRFWMVAHRSALVIYIFSVWHALLLGADFPLTRGCARTPGWRRYHCSACWRTGCSSPGGAAWPPRAAAAPGGHPRGTGWPG